MLQVVSSLEVDRLVVRVCALGEVDLRFVYVKETHGVAFRLLLGFFCVEGVVSGGDNFVAVVFVSEVTFEGADFDHIVGSFSLNEIANF